MKVEGGCHCGIVRFEVDLPEGEIEVRECDCSICSMIGYRHMIVPDKDFRITEGRRETTSYRFGSGTAQHIFCTQCGIKSFFRPRGRPTEISINLRCLDDPDDLTVKIVQKAG